MRFYSEELIASRVREFISGACQPVKRESPEEWIGRTIRLDRRQTTDYAGEYYDIRKVPHARIIFDFFRDPYAKELNLMKSSAAAISTSLIAAMVWKFYHDPCNMIYLINSRDEMLKMSKTVVQPFLEQAFGASIIGDPSQTNLHMQINGSELYMGSPTEGMMRNKQVGVVVYDEYDTYDDVLSGGGQDVDVAARERTKGSRNWSKIIRLSTPLYKFNPHLDPRIKQDKCKMHRAYLRGDMREFRVPCLHCGFEHELHEDNLYADDCKFEDGKWDIDRVREETRYKCPSCGALWREGAEKRQMVNAAKWVVTRDGATRRIWSARYTDLNALIGQSTWGDIKAELIEAEAQGMTQLAGVRRSRFGEPEDRERGAGHDRNREQILKHCGRHTRGTCPVMPWMVCMTVDVQKDASHFPWMIAAHMVNGDMHVIDWGDAEDWSELKDIRCRPIEVVFPDDAGVEPKTPQVWVSDGFIDSGHRAKGDADEADPKKESVYNFCLQSYQKNSRTLLFYPVKGAGGRQIKGLTDDSHVEIRGVYQIPLYRFDDNAFKRELYLGILPSDPADPTPRGKLHPDIWFPRLDDMDEDIVRQLLSERLMDKEVRNTITGKTEVVRVWAVSRDTPNDLGDCLKVQKVAFALKARWMSTSGYQPGGVVAS